MRTINLRLTLVSIGLTAIVALGANLLHDIQLRRSAGILLELGTQKIKEGHPNQALGFLTNYTKLAPHNVDAQILLADTLSHLRQTDQAMKWYENALLRDAGRHAARRKLVELAISSRRFTTAKAHLVDFLLPYTPDDPKIYYLLGRCHEGLGDFAKAIQTLQEAIKRDPTLIDAYTRLADLLRTQRKNSEEADALMDGLISKAQTDARARIARADYRAKYRLVGVLDDVREAVRLAPNDIQILFRAARTAQELATESRDPAPLLAESEGYAKKGLTLQPRFPGWYLALAQADRSRGNTAKAIARIEEGLSAIPNDGDLQWNLADLTIQQDRIEEGLGIVTRLGDQGYAKVPLEYLVALADARRNRFVDAVERWRKIRGEMDDWPDLARQTEYWLGVCYEHLGEYGLQLTSFRNAVKIDPAWIPARQWLANALARTGRINEAITEYEELAKLTGVPNSVYRDLGKLLVLRELQRRHEERDWPRVLSFLDRAAKLDQEADDYLVLRAEVQAAQGQKDAARQTLKEGIQSHPKSISCRLALASLEQSAEHWDVADGLISETQTKFTEMVEVRLARLQYLVQRYGIDASDKLHELEQKGLEGSLADKQRWRTGLAAAYYTLGKYADAGRLWHDALEKEPDNILLQMFLFDLALADGDDAKMRQLLAEIRRVERSDEQPLWRYGEATRLVMQARKGDTSALPKAERLLEEVRAARQIWARVPLLQAEIDEIRGEYDKVVEHYLTAIDLGERSPTIVRRVVALLYRERRYSEADAVLHKLEATQLPITGDLGRLAADVSFRVQDFSRAMQIAVQVIGKSDSYQDLVWMAQLHSVMGQPQAAEEKLQEAIKKQPKLPDAWIALVQHFVRSQSPAKARLAVDALTKNVEKNALAFVEAVCLDALGDLPAAAKQFEEATRPSAADAIVLRAASDFFLSHGFPAKSTPLLKRLIALKGASKTDLQWARRNLAIVSVATGDNAAKQKAVALIEQNLKENSSSSEDRRAKAICLESLGGNTNTEMALAIVQELINSRQSKSADYLLAYQLCLKLGRTGDARRYLEQHTFENSKDPQNLARYISFVLDKDDIHEAKLWIDRLQKLCDEGIKQSIVTKSSEQQIARFHRYFIIAIGLEARVLIKQNDSKAAIARITQCVTSSGSVATSSLSNLEAAEILEVIAGQLMSTDKSAANELLSAAESFLRSGPDRSSRESVALIAFLARRDRLPEAMNVWKEQFNSSAADDFSLAAAALAAHRQTKSSDLSALIQRVKSARGANPSKELLTGLGQLLSFDGQHAEAIAVYRELLARDPKDVATMNNLACYLALSGNDKKEALELVNAAIKINGATPSLLDSRGMVLLEMNRPEEALRDLRQAIQMAQSGTMYLHLAAAQKRLKQDQECADSMAQARQAGLDIDRLHPLERTRYMDLLKHASL